MRIKSTYVGARNHLANALAADTWPGLPEAIAHYEEGRAAQTGFSRSALQPRGGLCEAGRLEAAIEQLEIAARLNPTSPTIRDNLEKLKARRTSEPSWIFLRISPIGADYVGPIRVHPRDSREEI